MTGIYWEPRPREGAPCPRCKTTETLTVSTNRKKGYRRHVCTQCGKKFKTDIPKRVAGP